MATNWLTRNRRQEATLVGALFVVWVVFAVWQYNEYQRQRQLARDTLQRQAHSVMHALVGGIRSHRRMGPFLSDQLDGVLQELVKSEDVLTAKVTSDDGQVELAAGESQLLVTGKPPSSPGESWLPAGFQLVERLGLTLEPAGPGTGGGFGRGRGRRLGSPLAEEESAFTRTFTISLLVDRSGTDRASRNAGRLRSAVAVGGAVVLLCVVLAWRTSVRLVEARGQTRFLEAQAKHLREMSQAAAGLAHETRNPLGVIRGCTQRMAQSDSLGPDQQHQAQAIVEECDRVVARINQFLAFARPHEPEPRPVDPDLLIAEIAVLLEPDLDAKELQLHHVKLPRPVRIEADREMLRQALFNMIQNAIQFSPQRTTVDVQVTSSQDGIYRIDVSDRGPGVPDGNVKSLFTPYFTTRSDGTGLGLATVRQIATSHGWPVHYIPRPDGGSIFRLDEIRGGLAKNNPDRG